MGRKVKATAVVQPLSCNLKSIKPITINQNSAFKAYHSGYNLILHGVAGTGKTYVSLFLALNSVLSLAATHEQVLVIRSVVPTREVGYLPGSLKEKISVYEDPYRDICNDLLQFGTAYEELKARKQLAFATTSYLRGLTFKNTVIVVDEMQNLSYEELRTVITRVGDGSRLIFAGDCRQSDLERSREREGLGRFISVLDNMESFARIEFGYDDIVRNDLVKDFIIQEGRYQECLSV